MIKTATITKATILSDVYRITSYQARSAENFDNLSASADDKDLLDGLLDDSITELIDEFKKYSASFTDPNFSFTLPSNVDNPGLLGLEKSIKMFLVSRVCSKWFDVNHLDAGVHDKTSIQQIVNIKRMFNLRTKPV